MSELGETPAQLTLRKSKEKKITDFNKAGDGTQADREMDTYPYGEPRKLLGAAAFYHTLLEKGSKAARFWKKEAIAEAGQVTEEIPIVTPEMIKDAAA